MKKLNYLLVILLIQLTTSCNNINSPNIVIQHPGKPVTIEVISNKSVIVGPWSVTLNIKAFNHQESSISFEVYASEISEKTVSYSWVDDETCMLVFIQEDESHRNFKITANSNTLEIIPTN